MNPHTASASFIAALLMASAGSSQTLPPPVAHPAPSRVGSTERGTRLILLGTGGGPGVHTQRSQPASLLVVDGRPYLIDCGDGTVEQLKRAGFDAPQIGHVFITHLHFDHVGGLAALIGFDWTSGAASRPIDIYGPGGTQALLKGDEASLSIPEQIFTAILPPHPPIAEMVRGHDLEVTSARLVYSDDKIKVTAVENTHYEAVGIAAQAYGQTRSYSYWFETPDRTIVFTGDTGPSLAVVSLARGADILVSEVIDIARVLEMIKQKYSDSTSEARTKIVAHQTREHLTPDEVGKLAAAAGVGMVVLSHIVPGEESEHSSLSYTEGVRHSFHRPVIAGRDLDSF